MSDKTYSPAGVSAAFADRLWHMPAKGLDAALAATMLWLERSSQRRQLQELSDHSLHDLGLTRSDVVSESSKWFWRP